MLERLHHFDEGGNASGRIQMANVGFGRTQTAKLLLVGGLAERLGEGRHFDGIADAGAGAVGLDVINRAGVDVGQSNRFSNRPRLPVHAGGQVVDLARAVVVDGRSFDDSVNGVTRLNRIRQAAQRDNANAAAKNRAVGIGIKGAAVAV